MLRRLSWCRKLSTAALQARLQARKASRDRLSHDLDARTCLLHVDSNVGSNDAANGNRDNSKVLTMR